MVENLIFKYLNQNYYIEDYYFFDNNKHGVVIDETKLTDELIEIFRCNLQTIDNVIRKWCINNGFLKYDLMFANADDIRRVLIIEIPTERKYHQQFNYEISYEQKIIDLVLDRVNDILDLNVFYLLKQNTPQISDCIDLRDLLNRLGIKINAETKGTLILTTMRNYETDSNFRLK